MNAMNDNKKLSEEFPPPEDAPLDERPSLTFSISLPHSVYAIYCRGLSGMQGRMVMGATKHFFASLVPKVGKIEAEPEGNRPLSLNVNLSIETSVDWRVCSPDTIRRISKELKEAQSID
jgi:hypothetical protein